MDPPLLIALLSLGLSLFSFFFFLSYLRRRTSRERVLGEFRDEIDRMIAEIDNATDRDAALVEDRIKSLRTMLEDTDKRIALYGRELERRQSQEQAYRALGKPRPVSAAASSAAAPAPSAAVAAPALAAAPPGASPGDSPAPAAAPGPASPPAAPGEGPDPREPAPPRFVRAARRIAPKPPPFAEQVAELYRGGFSADLIASRLGVALAEVDLAIAILESRGS
jgi:hypothetical protein